MTANDDEMDAVRAAGIARNIEQVQRFFEGIAADPSRLDRLPDEAAFVVVPPDDTAVAAANVALAERIGDEGHPTYLWITDLAVGADPARPAEGEPVIAFRPFALPWANDGGHDRLVVYDAGRDTLLVDTLGGTRQGVALRPDAAAYFVVADLRAREAFGYLIPYFLARAVREVPRLALAMVAAEFRPLRQEELGGIDDAVLHRSGNGPNEESRQNGTDIDDLRSDIALLSA